MLWVSKRGLLMAPCNDHRCMTPRSGAQYHRGSSASSRSTISLRTAPITSYPRVNQGPYLATIVILRHRDAYLYTRTLTKRQLWQWNAVVPGYQYQRSRTCILGQRGHDHPAYLNAPGAVSPPVFWDNRGAVMMRSIVQKWCVLNLC